MRHGAQPDAEPEDEAGREDDRIGADVLERRPQNPLQEPSLERKIGQVIGTGGGLGHDGEVESGQPAEDDALTREHQDPPVWAA